MDLSTVDFSGWPPALVWSVIVIVVVCKLLPDVLGPFPTTTTSLRSSTGGMRSAPSVPTIPSSSI